MAPDLWHNGKQRVLGLRSSLGWLLQSSFYAGLSRGLKEIIPLAVEKWRERIWSDFNTLKDQHFETLDNEIAQVWSPSLHNLVRSFRSGSLLPSTVSKLTQVVGSVGP